MTNKLCMTPKQKAFHLVVEYAYVNGMVYSDEQARQFALIAVDEIISAIGFNVNDEYWLEVKKELLEL